MRQQQLFVLFLRILHPAHKLWMRLARPLTLGVRVILACEGGVVLVRHTYQPGWQLPGGGVKRGETLDAAARREVAEEVGLRAGRMRLMGMFTNFHEFKSDHVAVFACDEFDLAALRPDLLEIAEARIFPLSALPDELSPGHRRRIEEWVQGSAARVGTW
jgi:8-oxo-dGTP pyrophosphatase MutT (NUDIX family)